MRLRPTTQFRKDQKLAKKRGCDMALLAYVIRQLLDGQALADKHHDHALVGDYIGERECHIQPDWLFVYHIEEDGNDDADEDGLMLVAMRTGTHADLFGK